MSGLDYYLCVFVVVITLTAYLVVRINSAKRKAAKAKSEAMSKVAHEKFHVSAEIDGFRASFKLIVDDVSKHIIIMRSISDYKEILFSEIIGAEIYVDGEPYPGYPQRKSTISALDVLLRSFTVNEKLLCFDAWEATGHTKRSIRKSDSIYGCEFRKGVATIEKIIAQIERILAINIREL